MAVQMEYTKKMLKYQHLIKNRRNRLWFRVMLAKLCVIQVMMSSSGVRPE